MSEVKRLNYIFSVKEGELLVFFPVNKGKNIGYAGRMGRHMVPVLQLEIVYDDESKRHRLSRTESVLFTPRSVWSIVQAFVDMFDGLDGLIDHMVSKCKVFILTRARRGYQVIVSDLAKYIEGNISKEVDITPDKMRKIVLDENKLAAFNDFDGIRVADWYDRFAEERGWLEKRHDASRPEQSSKEIEEDNDWL